MNRYIYGRRLLDERQRLRRWIDPRIGSLRVADVVAYLRRQGWVEVTSDRPRTFVFREPAVPGPEMPFYQFVPDSEERDDYRQQLFEVLTGVAEFEDRQAAAVIDDVIALAARSSQTNGARSPTVTAESTH